MARLFDDASNEYLQYGSALPVSEPFAVAGWVRPDADQTMAPFSISVSGSDDNYYLLLLRGGDRNVECHSRTTVSGVADSAGTWAVGSWSHVGALWLIPDERHAYLHGGNKGSNAITHVPSGMDVTSLGRLDRSSSALYVSGRMAEFAVWDVTDWGASAADREAEWDRAIAALADGFSPLFFPLGLLAYWPLGGIYDADDGDRDIVGSYDMTAYNTPSTADHPGGLVYPSGPHVVAAAGGAAVGAGVSQVLGGGIVA